MNEIVLTDEEVISCIRNNECTSKETILQRLKRKIEKYSEKAKSDLRGSKAYNMLIAAYLVALYENIQNAVLFEELPNYWIYRFDLEYDEFSLTMNHIKKYNVHDDMSFQSSIEDAVYKLITIRPKAFSVEQYSKFYDVEQGNVRQWIRRGKIRTAYKEGSEWKIPELTALPSRGYEDAQYKWLHGVDNLPEEYQYLSNYCIATFFQDRKDKTKFHVLFVSKETFSGGDQSSNKELLLDAKEREKLELFMISHPQIKYAGSII